MCMAEASTHASVPCGHLCACARCAALMGSCPVCRARSALWVRIYGVPSCDMIRRYNLLREMLAGHLQRTHQLVVRGQRIADT